MAFDRKCYDLAEEFLRDETEIATAMEIAGLAQMIQTTIEDWLAFWRADYASLRQGELEHATRNKRGVS